MTTVSLLALLVVPLLYGGIVADSETFVQYLTDYGHKGTTSFLSEYASPDGYRKTAAFSHVRIGDYQTVREVFAAAHKGNTDAAATVAGWVAALCDGSIEAEEAAHRSVIFAHTAYKVVNAPAPAASEGKRRETPRKRSTAPVYVYQMVDGVKVPKNAEAKAR